MLRSRITLILLLVAVPATVVALRLHARLERAFPGVGSSIPGTPPAVLLWFNQPVNPELTSATILTADSLPVSTVAFIATPDSLLVAGPVGAVLTPGEYRVQWRTMSSDGHVIRGAYRFRYAPPGPLADRLESQ